jgi:hypothetical protein
LAPWPYEAQGKNVSAVQNASVESALRQSLAARGFVPATNAPPDFVVAYRLSEHQAWGWLGADNSEFTMGIVTVGFFNPSMNRLLWIGRTETRVSRPLSQDQARLDRVVGTVVSHSPRVTM